MAGNSQCRYFDSTAGSHWTWQSDRVRASQRHVAWRLLHIALIPFAAISMLLTLAGIPVLIWFEKRRTATPAATGSAKLQKLPNTASAFALSACPDISVVIPFYNRANAVHECLNSILSQTLSGGRTAEIIAVDNGSTDGTRQLLEACPVTLVDCEVRGPAAARNAGIRAARGKIIAFTDSDCVAEPSWLDNLLSGFSDERVQIVGGQITAMHTHTGPAMFAHVSRLLDNEKFFSGTLCFPPFAATANAAFRKAVLDDVGGFDPDLYMSEDADLSWRVLAQGGIIAYCSDSIIRHAHRDDVLGLFQQAKGYGRAAVAGFYKNRGKFRMAYFVDYQSLRILAWLLVAIPYCIVTKSGFTRVVLVYDAVFRTAFTLGRLQASIQNKVLFV